MASPLGLPEAGAQVTVAGKFVGQEESVTIGAPYSNLKTVDQII